MNIFRLLWCGVFLFTWWLNASSQDFAFSQFYAHRVYLNPAFTGMEPGLTATAVSKLQWLNVDNGFKIVGASIEIQEPYLKSGFGLNLYQSSEGLFDFQTTSVGFTYAYTLPWERNNLHIGLQYRWQQKSLDWDKVIFSDELDPVFGPVLPTSAVQMRDRTSFMDADFGILYRFDGKRKVGSGSIRSARTSLGVSFHHLFGYFNGSGANESFLNLDTRVAPRFTFHMGSIIPVTILKGVNNEFSISPNFRFDMQGPNLFAPKENLKIYSLGSYFLFKGFYLGGFFQSKTPFPSGPKDTQAWTAVLGAYLPTGYKNKPDDHRFFIGLSIDFNSTGVGTTAGNVYEIALRYNFANMPGLFGKKGGATSKQILDCKHFY